MKDLFGAIEERRSEDEERDCGNYWGMFGMVKICLSPVYVFDRSRTASPSPKYLLTENLFNPPSIMSNPIHTMKTRAKNAIQHPGYAQQKPSQPADSNTAVIKARKAKAATAVKAAVTVVKKVNNTWLYKFKQEAMDLGDMLMATLIPTSLLLLVTSCPLPLNLALLALHP